MGWDGSIPTNFKNGRVDKKAELDSRYTWENDTEKCSVKKSKMVGSEYYAAIEYHNFEKSIYEVIGLVALTRMSDGYLMAKTMEETVGPCYYDCPTDILDLLTPTENEYALKWRKKCRENAIRPKLTDLKAGTIITFVSPFDTKHNRKGDIVQLEKRSQSNHKRKSYKWIHLGQFAYWPAKMIPTEFVILKEGSK